MKELINYINEKLDINKVSLKTESFPIEENTSNIIKFLKYCKFKEIDYSQKLFYRVYLIDVMNSTKAKCFYYDKRDGELAIADTQQNEISNQNPMYLISGLSKPYQARDYFGYYKVDKDIADYDSYYVDEFLKKIEKIL